MAGILLVNSLRLPENKGIVSPSTLRPSSDPGGSGQVKVPIFYNNYPISSRYPMLWSEFGG